MVNAIKSSFVDDLRSMEWLDDETRSEALKKAIGT